MSMKRRVSLTTTAALLLAALCLAAQPAAAQQQQGCGNGAVGHMTLHLEPDSGLAWADTMTVGATLCDDETAVGGGRVALILENNFVNADPAFELPEGTVMTFWYAPYTWFSFGPGEALVAAELTPIGQFRRQVLEALDGDRIALEDWLLFLSPDFPEGGHDLDGDGDADPRFQVWWR